MNYNMIWIDECQDLSNTQYKLMHGGRASGKATAAKLLFEEDQKEMEEKRIATVGVPGQINPKQPLLYDKMSKHDVLKALRKALEASGHSRARAIELAKVHYKKYLGQKRDW